MSDENPETAILSHEEIYRGKIVTLHVDTIRQASGTSTIREVVLHPGGVTAIPVLKDGRLLLIRQFRYPIGKFILELPAGKLDSGQTPLDTIAREIEEETGYCAGTLTHECTFYTTPGFSNESIHLFLARDLTLKPAPGGRRAYYRRIPRGVSGKSYRDQRRQNHPRHPVSPKYQSLLAGVSGRKCRTGEINDGKTYPRHSLVSTKNIKQLDPQLA